MTHRLLLLSVFSTSALFVSACGNAATSPSPRSPASSGASQKAGDRSNSEQPLTPAVLSLDSEFASAKPQNSPRSYGASANTSAFRLAGGEVGFLDPAGSRAVATIHELKHLNEPEKLTALCVALDGKLTFGTTAPAGAFPKLWAADSFEGPLRALGTTIAATYGAVRPAWLVRGEKGVSIADCDSGTIEPIAAVVSSATLSRWIPAMRIIRVHSPSPACFVKTPADKSWVRLNECNERPRADRSTELTIRHRDGKAWHDTCAFVIAENGSKQPCGTPVGPPAMFAPPSTTFQIREARYYARSKAVIPGKNGSLFAMASDGTVDESSPVAPQFVGCSALAANQPLYLCATGDGFEAVVYVGAEGVAKEEWRRRAHGRKIPDWRALRTPFSSVGFFSAADGGVAVGGDCEGTPGNVACVRTKLGTWRTVPFSEELTDALTQTTPFARLLPTTDGRLFVSSAVMNTIHQEVNVKLFDAEQSSPLSFDHVPSWTLSMLSSYRVTLPAASQDGAQFYLSSTDQVRVWPLTRQHPVFRVSESCGITFHRDGISTTDCLQGKVSAVGRMGLWEKQPGEVFETLDAGVTWMPVALPKGIDSGEFQCFSIGCRIGPYWRMGWGPDPKP